MLSYYDYTVIAVYFVFMITIGVVFQKLTKNTSDYFRGGGQMLWWIVGSSAFMTQFSAWTFTGAAGKAYDNGIVVLAFYAANALGFFINYLGTARRLRQMRIITTLEGIRQRWGVGNEQFFTWLSMPVGILTAGISLNGLGVILSSVFGIPLPMTIFGAGIVVVVMTTLGGSWAATASDFIQMLILMAITLAAAVLALHAIGGVGEFVARVPDRSFTWGQLDRGGILGLWVFAVFLKQFLVINNMSDGYRYLCAKDDQHARRGALLATVLFIIGPAAWF
ncbi:MAG: transporter, partial [Opitutaceae bacterium]|nr:transporter [Opitutaceae bacterium]